MPLRSSRICNAAMSNKVQPNQRFEPPAASIPHADTSSLCSSAVAQARLLGVNGKGWRHDQAEALTRK